MLFTTVQISDFHERKIRRNVFRQGRIQNFHLGGAAGPGGAVLLAEGALYLLRRAQSCVERARFRARRAPLLVEGAPYLLTGRLHGEKGVFSFQKGASSGGRKSYLLRKAS